MVFLILFTSVSCSNHLAKKVTEDNSKIYINDNVNLVTEDDNKNGSNANGNENDIDNGIVNDNGKVGAVDNVKAENDNENADTYNSVKDYADVDEYDPYDFNKWPKITFSGYEWYVKTWSEPIGPGPNYFTNDKKNVWVDEEGLHLKVRYEDGKWLCSEVVCSETLGYGEYIFKVNGRIDELDPNIVFGMFTWDDNKDVEYHREIDIEFTKWGKANNPNSQFSVQPSTVEENIKIFNTALEGTLTTHVIDWQEDRIKFQSLHGNKVPAPEDYLIIEMFDYQGEDIPTPGDARIRINLWLFQGNQPNEVKDFEVIITEFEFIPAEG